MTCAIAVAGNARPTRGSTETRRAQGWPAATLGIEFVAAIPYDTLGWATTAGSTIPGSWECRGRRPASRLLDGPAPAPRQRVGEDRVRLLVHRGCDRPLGRGRVPAHDLVTAAARRVDAGTYVVRGRRTRG